MTIAVRPQPMSGDTNSMCGWTLKPILGSSPAHARSLAKPNGMNGPPRSEAKTRARLTALELPGRPQFVAEERVRRRLTALGGRTHCAGLECDSRL